MEILAHRGMWFQRDERNTYAALCAALEAGYGLETDIRDLDGELVIAHDMPRFGALPLEQVLGFYARGGHRGMLALNIKSDGLHEPLQRMLQAYSVTRYFVFDMAVPDTLGYLARAMPTYVRHSELEDHPQLRQRAQGVWLDELMAPWVDATVLQAQCADAPGLCLVSAELHGRPHGPQWAHVRTALDAGVATATLALCTDFPQEAERFFQ